MSAIIFDWDGTLVSCEEKIDSAVRQLCSSYPEIREPYETAIAEKKTSPGWQRKSFLASLPEDYFTYHFGIVADILAKTHGIADAWQAANDAAWSVILKKFRELYRDTSARLLVDRAKLRDLAKHSELYVISNSHSRNVREEAMLLGLGTLPITFIGDAKKYHVAASEPKLLGVSAARPHYRQAILSVQEKHRSDVMIVGDNFSLDLVTPIAAGLRVAYIPNPLTPKEVTDFIQGRNILSGNINEVLDVLVREKKGEQA